MNIKSFFAIKRLYIGIVVLFLALLSLPTISLAANPAAKTHAVAIKNLAFSPANLTIAKGDTVTWTNDDSVAHTIASKDGTLNSKSLSKGDTYSYTFDKPGVYDYFCSIHPNMTGKITVK